MSAKSKAAGVSASSFWDLKAEVAKHEAHLVSVKATGGQLMIKGGIPRPEKKGRTWGKSNKGVTERAAKDSAEWARVERPTYEAAQAALARKAKVYNKLRKGQTGGLTEDQYDALLVDFDEKRFNDHYESDSDDVNESLTVPTPLDENDPIVEYQDEFGRIRSAKRSEVPREYMNNLETSAVEDDDPYVIHGPVNHFPVYEPDPERLAKIRAAAEEAEKPLASHYDSTREVRAKGAAFYQFSADEQERQRQLDELKQSRGETIRTREETGAIDMPVGLEPDMGSTPQTQSHSRAHEKRKRELEMRRQAIEAKRRKKEEVAASATTSASSQPAQGVVEPPAAAAPQGPSRVRAASPPPNPRTAADDFLANLERDLEKQRR